MNRPAAFAIARLEQGCFWRLAAVVPSWGEAREALREARAPQGPALWGSGTLMSVTTWRPACIVVLAGPDVGRVLWPDDVDDYIDAYHAERAAA
ncbi:MAG: hypothetical protein Q8Q14_00620 [Gemmatimonadales bacterium]|nr:hypothetical protein [Gemmatimonadales bacterium]